MPDDCRPNKALRTTIKVFLKRKVMERETARKKEALEKAAIPATPATPLPDQTPAPQHSETPAPRPTSAVVHDSDVKQGSRDESQAAQAQDDADSKADESAIPTEAQRDIPQESIEVKSLIHIIERSSLTFSSPRVLRFPDEHLRKRPVKVVLVRKR